MFSELCFEKQPDLANAQRTPVNPPSDELLRVVLEDFDMGPSILDVQDPDEVVRIELPHNLAVRLGAHSQRCRSRQNAEAFVLPLLLLLKFG